MNGGIYSKKNFRHFFEKVWKEIGNEMQGGFLKNEGELQCILYSKLIKKIKKYGLLLRVESQLLIQTKKENKIIPDMLILKESNVVKCIIELKFSKTYVTFEKDWINFYKIFKYKNEVFYRNYKLDIEYKLNLKKLDWFIFAYVDNCYDGDYQSAVGTRKKVEPFLEQGKPGMGIKYWRKSLTRGGLPNLKWLKGRYIHAHGELNRNDWKVDIF